MSEFVFKQRILKAEYRSKSEEEQSKLDLKNEMYWETKTQKSAVGRDPLDPTKGSLIRFDGNNGLLDQLPRILMKGLWDSVVVLIVRDTLGLSVSELELKNLVSELSGGRYGFFPPHQIPVLMQKLGCDGVSFSMLQLLVSKMGLAVEESVLRRAYNILDVNHDNNLSRNEFLQGFNLLFRDLIPQLVLIQCGLTMEQIVPVLLNLLVTLALIFSFLTFAFQAFVGASDGVGSCMQSSLAAGAALGAKASSSKDTRKLQAGAVKTVEELMNVSKSSDEGGGSGAAQSSSDSSNIVVSTQSQKQAITSISYSLPKVQTKKGEAAQVQLEAGKLWEFKARISAAGGAKVDISKLDFFASPRLPAGLDFVDGNVKGTPKTRVPFRVYTVMCVGGHRPVKTKFAFSVTGGESLPAFVEFLDHGGEEADEATGSRVPYCIPTPLCPQGHCMERSSHICKCDGDCGKSLPILRTTGKESRLHFSCLGCCWDLCGPCGEKAMEDGKQQGLGIGALIPYNKEKEVYSSAAVCAWTSIGTKKELDSQSLRFEAPGLKELVEKEQEEVLKAARLAAKAQKETTTADQTKTQDFLNCSAAGLLKGMLPRDLYEVSEKQPQRKQLALVVKQDGATLRFRVMFVDREQIEPMQYADKVTAAAAAARQAGGDKTPTAANAAQGAKGASQGQTTFSSFFSRRS